MQFVHDIASLPFWFAFLLLVAIPTLVAVCGPLVVRRYYSIDVLVENNEVAGFKFATLGVVYAVLLGLAVVSVWEKFAEAEVAVAREAGAVASLYRLAGAGVEGEGADRMVAAITTYGRTVVDRDWPAMEENRESPEALAALNALFAATLTLPEASPRAGAVLGAALDQLDALTDARRERLGLAEGVVPDVIWLTLFAGAAITIGFTFFFGLRNYGAQLLMTGMLSVTIFLALFVGLQIDEPFTGTIRVPPEAMEMVLRDFAPPA